MKGPRLNPNLLEIPLYIAGKSIEEVREELGLEEVYKLASNESPVGPSPLAIQAAQSILDQAHRYPGILDRDLRRKLASQLDSGLDEDNFVIGNGGTDALRMITQAFVFDGGNTVMSRVTFPMYRILTTAFGGIPIIVEPAPEYRHDLDAMIDQIDEDTRLVFLCSPNNPSGHIISQKEAEKFLDRIPPHVVVVFDESYYDYVTDPTYAKSLVFVKEGRNVLVVRSFSKAGGLANLRIGYLVGPIELSSYVQRTRLPFQVGDIAISAAIASLDDEEFYTRQFQVIANGRDYLLKALGNMGLKCLPSQANFVTIFDPPVEVSTIVNLLLQKGFVVRGMASFGMRNGVRVSVGPMDINQKFIQALHEILETQEIRLI